MTGIPLKPTFPKGQLLADSKLAASVARRAQEVGGLLRERRKLSLAYRRTADAASLVELKEIDEALAQHRIDIPAIAERRAARSG